MKLSNTVFSIGLFFLLVLVGCTSTPTAALTITPASASIPVSASVSLSANEAVTWASSDPTIAFVDGNGLVTGLQIGTVTVTATGTVSRKQATATINVIGLADTVSISPTTLPKLAINGTLQLSASVTGAKGSENISQDVKWTSDNPGVATVSNAGVVTGVAAGTVKITAASSVTPAKTSTVSIEVTPLLTLSYPAFIATVTRPVSVSPNVGGGDGKYSYTGSLPAGLTLDPATGVISGKPSAVADLTPYTITVTDGINSNAAATFNLTVNNVPIIPSIAPIQITRTKSYAGAAPATTGGTPALVYTISPALPAGLTLDPNTGAISGTPTVATAAATYTLTVTDVNGAKGSTALNLTVNALPTFATAYGTPLSLTAGNSFLSVTPVIAGGSAPFKYNLDKNLPVGLNLNPDTGVISGIPAQATAAASYTVTVTDNSMATATVTFTLEVK